MSPYSTSVSGAASPSALYPYRCSMSRNSGRADMHARGATHPSHKLVHTVGVRAVPPPFLGGNPSSFPVSRRLPPPLPSNFLPSGAKHRVDCHGNEHIHVGRHCFPLFSHPLFRQEVASDVLVMETVDHVLHDEDSTALRRMLDDMVDNLVQDGASAVTVEEIEALLHARSAELDVFRPCGSVSASLTRGSTQSLQAPTLPPKRRWQRFPSVDTTAADAEEAAGRVLPTPYTDDYGGGAREEKRQKENGRDHLERRSNKTFYSVSTILERTSMNIQQRHQQQQELLKQTKKKKSKLERGGSPSSTLAGKRSRSGEERTRGISNRMENGFRSRTPNYSEMEVSSRKEFTEAVASLRHVVVELDRSGITDGQTGTKFPSTYSSGIPLDDCLEMRDDIPSRSDKRDGEEAKIYSTSEDSARIRVEGQGRFPFSSPRSHADQHAQKEGLACGSHIQEDEENGMVVHQQPCTSSHPFPTRAALSAADVEGDAAFPNVGVLPITSSSNTGDALGERKEDSYDNTRTNAANRTLPHKNLILERITSPSMLASTPSNSAVSAPSTASHPSTKPTNPSTTGEELSKSEEGEHQSDHSSVPHSKRKRTGKGWKALQPSELRYVEGRYSLDSSTFSLPSSCLAQLSLMFERPARQEKEDEAMVESTPTSTEVEQEKPRVCPLPEESSCRSPTVKRSPTPREKGALPVWQLSGRAASSLGSGRIPDPGEEDTFLLLTNPSRAVSSFLSFSSCSEDQQKMRNGKDPRNECVKKNEEEEATADAASLDRCDRLAMETPPDGNEKELVEEDKRPHSSQNRQRLRTARTSSFLSSLPLPPPSSSSASVSGAAAGSSHSGSTHPLPAPRSHQGKPQRRSTTANRRSLVSIPSSSSSSFTFHHSEQVQETRVLSFPHPYPSGGSSLRFLEDSRNGSSDIPQHSAGVGRAPIRDGEEATGKQPKRRKSKKTTKREEHERKADEDESTRTDTDDSPSSRDGSSTHEKKVLHHRQVGSHLEAHSRPFPEGSTRTLTKRRTPPRTQEERDGREEGARDASTFPTATRSFTSSPSSPPMAPPKAASFSHTVWNIRSGSPSPRLYHFDVPSSSTALSGSCGGTARVVAGHPHAFYPRLPSPRPPGGEVSGESRRSANPRREEHPRSSSRGEGTEPWMSSAVPSSPPSASFRPSDVEMVPRAPGRHRLGWALPVVREEEATPSAPLFTAAALAPASPFGLETRKHDGNTAHLAQGPLPLQQGLAVTATHSISFSSVDSLVAPIVPFATVPHSPPITSPMSMPVPLLPSPVFSSVPPPPLLRTKERRRSSLSCLSLQSPSQEAKREEKRGGMGGSQEKRSTEGPPPRTCPSYPKGYRRHIGFQKDRGRSSSLIPPVSETFKDKNTKEEEKKKIPCPTTHGHPPRRCGGVPLAGVGMGFPCTAAADASPSRSSVRVANVESSKGKNRERKSKTGGEEENGLAPITFSLQSLMPAALPQESGEGGLVSSALPRSMTSFSLRGGLSISGGGGRVMGVIDTGYAHPLLCSRSPLLPLQAGEEVGSSVSFGVPFQPIRDVSLDPSTDAREKKPKSSLSKSFSSPESSPRLPLRLLRRGEAGYPTVSPAVGHSGTAPFTSLEPVMQEGGFLSGRVRASEEGTVWDQAVRIAVYSLLHQRLELIPRVPLQEVGRRENGLQVTHALDAFTLQQLYPHSFGTLDVSMDGNTGHVIHVRPKPVLKAPKEGSGGESEGCEGGATGMGYDGSVGKPGLLPTQISKMWQHTQEKWNRERRGEIRRRRHGIP